MIVIKELLLQFLIAASPAVLFPIFMERWDDTLNQDEDEAPGRLAKYYTVLASFSALSLVLCSLLSSNLMQVVPLNFGMVPVLVCFLYGRVSDSLFLTTVQVLIYIIGQDYSSPLTFMLQSGMVLYPCLFLSASRFKKSSKQRKAFVLNGYVAIAGILSMISPLLSGSYDVVKELSLGLTAIFIVILMIMVANLLAFVIEGVIEKEILQHQVSYLSRKYFREAEKLQQMIDATPLCIILLDQQGNIVSLNKTCLDLFQIPDSKGTKEGIIGKKLDAILIGFEMDDVNIRVRRTLERSEFTMELLQNEEKIYYTTTSPLQRERNRKSPGAVIIVQDITELEMLRMELSHVERLSLVGQMAAGITHEIRNPMAVVRGFLQLMREKSPDSIDYYYRIVMEELDRANGIINDFLSLAQNRVVPKQAYHLHDIIHELTPLLWADANLRGQSIDVQLGLDVPPLLLNEKEIKQLILNLSRNAMEAMGDKGNLIIETRMNDEDVELRVIDDGPGIPLGRQEKLFEPFYTTKAEGTGLGLSLCISIVERHSGKITVESQEGVGTTFLVTFRPVQELQE